MQKLKLKLKLILENLIKFQSITPNDKNCQDYLINLLNNLGFHCEKFDKPPVNNFFASYGTKSPCLIFAGHTDVVPTGDIKKWHSDPFCLYEKDNYWYGRGVADMKGSIVAMLIAAEEFIHDHPDFDGTLAFIITSGEEGDFFNNGTPHIMQMLHKKGLCFDYCIVGEPSSSKKIGDTIKIGRRGSLTGKLILHGKQGHVAYPHLAINPLHKLAPALNELTNMSWKNDNIDHISLFPPTSLQITHIHTGGEATNIIPGELTMHFNIRYAFEHKAEDLIESIEQCFARHNLNPEINWHHNGLPFLTKQGKLLNACNNAIQKYTQITPELSTGGGTSDGRFIAPYGIEVIELGPVNATIHQVNEKISIDDLTTLVKIYKEICEQLLCRS